MEKAKLCRTRRGNWEIRFEDPTKPPVPWPDVPQSFKDANQADPKAVRFNVHVRLEGNELIELVVPDAKPTTPASPKARRASEQSSPRSTAKPTTPASPKAQGVEGEDRRAVPTTRFRNPYNFVPVDDRSGFTGPLADVHPVGHARYAPGRLTGQITVRATVRTPLLLPPAADAKREEGERREHLVHGCRVGPDGKPWVAPSTLRGAIRARFEALTDSRFGVVSEQLDQVLAFRLGTDDAKRAVPAVVADSEGEPRVVPLLGSSSVPRAGDDPLWAGWWPMNCKAADRFEHGTFVKARLRRYGHVRPPRRRQEPPPPGQPPRVDYDIWVVEQAASPGELLPDTAWTDDVTGKTRASLDRYVPREVYMVVHGWVFRTSPSVKEPSNDRRKFERLFFVAAPDDGSNMTEQRLIDHAQARAGHLVSPLAGSLQAGWEGVIRAYDDAADDRARGPQGKQPGSAHLNKKATAHRDAKPGLLCYAVLDDQQRSIAHLSPVTIGREPYDRSPRELLPSSLDMARSWDELSPADRVFGWVHPDAGDAGDRRLSLRSSIRIGPARFTEPSDGEDPLIEDVSRTLAILSGPKPSYGRFYVADADGQPPSSGSKRRVGYREGNALRGRKVYPHHPRAESTPGWFDAESSRPWRTDQPSDQNRTVTQAVRPDAIFEFDITARNLNESEFGALLVLLEQAGGEGRLRLGYGRPLGFGSVELEVRHVRVETGGERADRLRRFDASLAQRASPDRLVRLKGAFLDAFYQAHGVAFDKHPIGRALLAEARGFDDEVPIEYPKARGAAESYKWFVSNENGGKGERRRPREPLGLLDFEVPYTNTRHPPP